MTPARATVGAPLSVLRLGRVAGVTLGFAALAVTVIHLACRHDPPAVPAA